MSGKGERCVRKGEVPEHSMLAGVCLPGRNDFWKGRG